MTDETVTVWVLEIGKQSHHYMVEGVYLDEDEMHAVKQDIRDRVDDSEWPREPQFRYSEHEIDASKLDSVLQE